MCWTAYSELCGSTSIGFHNDVLEASLEELLHHGRCQGDPLLVGSDLLWATCIPMRWWYLPRPDPHAKTKTKRRRKTHRL